MHHFRYHSGLRTGSDARPAPRWSALYRTVLLAGLLVAALLGLFSTYAAYAQQLPTLAVQPESGSSGTVVQLIGDDFPSEGNTGEILWDGAAVGSVFIDASGSFSAPFIVPLDAQPGQHRITVCSSVPCNPDLPSTQASAPFTVEQQSGPLTGSIAYIFDTATAAASTFLTLLTNEGFEVKGVQLSDVAAVDFAQFDLVIIGRDTGAGDAWGSEPAQIQQILDSGVKVLGLGDGGHAFFGQLGLSIGWPNGEFSNLFGEVLAADPSFPYFQQPYDFSAVLDTPLQLYRDNTREINVLLDGTAIDVTPLAHGSFGDFSTKYATLLRQGCRQLWGYNGDANLMSDLGRRLFINAVSDAIATPCTPLPLRVQVCQLKDNECAPVPNAIVHHLVDGQPVEPPLSTDGDGFVIDDESISFDDALWARLPVSPTRNYTSTTIARFYHTSGAPTEVLSSTVDADNVLRIFVSPQYPLWVQDLDVSAQWYVQSDPAQENWLREQLTRTSEYLYNFTDGQMLLGDVTVRQDYEGWDAADLQLHVSNAFQPNANIGGAVATDTVDLSPLITVSYNAGHIYMGSHWNRYGAPPNEPIIDDGEVVPTALMENDWALALVHEFGHYLLFLFDTYRDAEGQSSQEIAASCTNSAMGDIYRTINHGFVADQQHWDAACGATEAHHVLQGRTEWDTVALWYPWVITPTTFVTAPIAPPVDLTSVTFITPTSAPTGPPASQLFDLIYMDGETSSGEAVGYIYRGERIFNQGKPAKGSTQIQLTDARVDDRLCVYDINDYAESEESPRHQFGCERIRAGDAELRMTKFVPWRPLVKLTQTGPNQLSLSVTQTLTRPFDAQLFARLYPEHGEGLAPVPLAQEGTTHSATFTLDEPVPPVYVQLWVDENPLGATTRREAVAERGTGGGGAQGPARKFSGVFVVSADGQASYESDEPLDLQEGESIAWQSMPGTPPLPPGTRISGQSYRLDAYPRSLVENGVVRIRFDEIGPAARAAAAHPNAVSAPALYFWDETTWRRLGTTISTPANAADGVREAAAPSQGVGVYAVLYRSDDRLIFVPLIQR